MPDGFPCPNPTCTQTFPPDAVRGSAVLTCPRCGTVYKFAQTAPAAAKPAANPRPVPPPLPPVAPPLVPKPVGPPIAKSVGPPPVARAVTPAGKPAAKGGRTPPLPPPLPSRAIAVAPPVTADVPVAPAVRADRQPDPRLRLESSPDMITSPTRRRPRRGNWVRLGIAAVLVLGFCSAVGYGIYWVIKNAPEEQAGDDTPAVRKTEGNFAFDRPRGWKRDRDLQLSMKVGLSMSRTKPSNHFSLFYRDYKTRTPSDAEMLDEALLRLRNHFAVVNYEDPFETKEKGRTGTLGGETAIVFPFVGKERPPEELDVTGEVVMLTRQGYAYWFFFWGPNGEEEELLRAGWANVRTRFELFNQREGWKPQPRQSEPFSSDSGYRLDYVTFTPSSRGDKKLALWRKEEEPKDWGENCELVLKGYEPTLDEDTGKVRVVRYAGKLATVQVMVLDRKEDKDAGKGDKEPRGEDKEPKNEKKDAKDQKQEAKDAYKFAEAYVLKKVRDLENRPDASFKPLEDKQGRTQVDADVGAFRGRSSQLRVQLDADNERFGTLAVAPLSAEKLLVIYCDCPFDRGDYWKQEFRAVIETVRRAK